ncbi:RHS repeat-associated core domain-containing protein [Nocardioides sp. NPDC087217]|uniref:RHS repeat-associated core domain-containing protein n=1 Tax=Nocardioides sp. NPDC087217 TaxID=3364335 RepID=UPI003813ACAE
MDANTAAEAQIPGVMFTVTDQSGTVDLGKVDVALDYGAFENAVGGEWATRLQLVSYPACVLTTPTKPECRIATSVTSRRNYQDKQLKATVDLEAASEVKPDGRSASAEASPPSATEPVVLAATGDSSGVNGDFAATSLKPSGSWSQGGATGGFSWTYPLVLPPAATGSGIAPSLSLDYSSQSVDGQNTTSNNQASWVGQGWSLDGGYIERTYASCADDKDLPELKRTGDRCWTEGGNIITLQMPGAGSTALVRDDATGTWKPQTDTGLRIQRKTGADNGGHDGEYWLVTTADGTRYTFGREVLPNAAAGDKTDSAWVAPVYHPDASDPCHGSTDEMCRMVYRWNLDLIEDRHGNATVYDYAVETNHYGSRYPMVDAWDDPTLRAYDRGGYMKSIRYGMRADNLSAAAPQQVAFTVAERCFPTADFACNAEDATLANAAHWADSPIDQTCDAEGACEAHTPTFWTRKRLTTITTSYLGADDARHTVDTYRLGQSFYTDTSGELVLDSIARTGHNGAASVETPLVRFSMSTRHNRVLGLHGLPAMSRVRMHAIYTETGQDISIKYSGDPGQDGRAPGLCTPDTIPSAPGNNTTECYPVKWVQEGAEEPILDYFHKYVVTEIGIQDHNALAPMRLTAYTYKGTPAWHYDDNEVQKPKYRTWSQFRGYQTVETRSGNPGVTSEVGDDEWTLSSTKYFRGMDGDRLPGGETTRVATVTDSRGGSRADADWFAGQALETTHHNGDGGEVVSTTVHAPRVVDTTATRARDGLDPVKARIIQPGGSKTYTPHVNEDGTSGTMSSGTTTVYDGFGRATEVTNTATGSGTTCVKTTYVDNTTNWIRDKASQVTTYANTCPTDTTPSPKVLRATRTYYDGSTTLGEVTDGLPTKTVTATKVSGSTPDWDSNAQVSTTTYDAYGRIATSSVDNPGAATTKRTTTTTYTPAGPGALTKVTTTLPISSHKTEEHLDPGRGVTLKAVAVDGLVTEGTYDALGRLTAVWKPGQVKGTDQATETYDYRVSPDAPLAVTTNTLVDPGAGLTGNGTPSYRTRIVLYDAFGAIRQAQADGVGGGRVVTDTFNDSHGWAVKTYDHWYTTGEPTASIITTPQANIDDWQTTKYDGSGRPVEVTSYKTGSAVAASTKTIYSGNAVTVINPEGGVSSTTFTNGRGEKTELRNYKTLPTISGNRVSGGTYQRLTYTYDAMGQQLTQSTGRNNTTDTSLAATWSNVYDLAGRVTSVTTPDAGTVSTSYWDTGEVKTRTDATGRSQYFEYDAVGRQVKKKSGGASGTTLAEWAYDNPALGIGRIASSTSYDSGKSYTKTITGYDNAGHELGTTVTLNETGLNPSYTSTQEWTSTGLLESATTARSTSQAGGAGGASPETVFYEYDASGNPVAMHGMSVLVQNTTYTPYGEPAQYVFGVNDLTMAATFDIDAKSRHTKSVLLTGQLAAPQIEKLDYSYDPAGNITKVVNQQGNSSTGPVQTTCYDYDGLRQLTEAWSSKDGCATNPAVANSNASVDGPQAFWTSWAYDDAGNRTKQVRHGLGSAASTTTTYANGTSDTDTIPEHALASTSTTGAKTGSSSYTYNADGSMASRTVTDAGVTKKTSFSYGPDGEVQTVADPVASARYVYDADGNVLLRREKDLTTLFLPGQDVVVKPSTLATSAYRTYEFNGQTVAVRTNAGQANFLLADHNQTAQVSVNPLTWAVQRRYTDPYGVTLANKNGSAPGTVAGKRGFLDQPVNVAAGLSELGARLYDPAVGRFTSVDPILSSTDPAAANGYTYSGNNPVTFNDASGLQYMAGGPPRGVVYNTSSTPTPAEEPDPPKTFWDGAKDGGGEAIAEVISSFNPVEIYNNIKAVIKDPPSPAAFFKSVFSSLLHIDEAKAVYNAYKSGSDYEFGKALGKLAVSVSGDLATMIFGGGKAVSLIGKAAKAAKGSKNTPETDAASGGSCPTGRSFSGDTRVLLADGTSKPISQIQPGDVVWATDPVTGVAGPRPVLATWPHRDMLLVLEIDGQVLVTTEDHPFWSVTDQTWERADDLQVGEKVLSADGSSHLVTAPIDLTTAYYDQAFDLTVAGIHTFHVLTDPDRGPPVDVLVHNCDLAGYAESVRNEPGVKFASEYTSPSGATYYGRNRHGEAADGELAAALERTGHHGGCAEVHCLIQAQREEGPEAIRGGTMRTVRTRNNSMPTSNAAGHGEPAHPCGRCGRLQADLGIN